MFIEEEFRGQGYGKAVMEALEAKARRMKLSSLALHVFAFNDVAKHLYESMGYQTKSLNMMKKLRTCSCGSEPYSHEARR